MTESEDIQYLAVPPRWLSTVDREGTYRLFTNQWWPYIPERGVVFGYVNPGGNIYRLGHPSYPVAAGNNPVEHRALNLSRVFLPVTRDLVFYFPPHVWDAAHPIGLENTHVARFEP